MAPGNLFWPHPTSSIRLVTGVERSPLRMRLVLIQEERGQLFQTDGVDRATERLRYFSDAHPVQHDRVIAFQHLFRYQDKLAGHSVTRSQKILSSQQARN